MADEKPDASPEPDIDIEAVDDLPPEDLDKLKRGEIEAPRRKAEPVQKPEGKTEPGDDDEVDPKSDVVPYGKFHRQIERRKDAETRAEANERRAAEAEARANVAFQRMAELMEAARPPQEEQAAPADPGQEPDYEDNPIGWIAWRAQKDRFNDHQAEAQRAQQVEHQRRSGEFQRAVTGDVERFKAQTPDYQEAVTFYWNSRGPELMAMGYSQNEAAEIIRRDEMQIAQLALQRRQSPAATYYAIAKARGYQQGNGEQANGRDLPAKDPVTGKFVAASEAMDRREATKAAAKSLGGSGGPGDMGMPTPQQIADMEPAEFESFKKKWGSVSNYLARQ